MPENEGLKSLYQGLLSTNKVSEKQIGTYDQFSAYVADSNNANKLYTELTTNWGFGEKELDTWDNFNKYIQKRIAINPNIPDDNNKQALTDVSAQKIDGQPKKEKPQGDNSILGVAREYGNRFNQGVDLFAAGMARSPEYLYDLATGVVNKGLDLAGVPKEYQAMDSKAWGEKTGIHNRLAEIYESRAKQYEKDATELNPNFNVGFEGAIREGDFGLAARNLFGGISQSIPATVAIMASPFSRGATTGLSTLNFGSQQREEMIKDGAEDTMSKEAILFSSGLKGFAESFFENYFGAGAMGEGMKALLKSGTKEAAKDKIKKGLSDWFVKMVIENPKLAMFGEMFEEINTQIAQNLIDIYSGYKPEMKWHEGVIDAGAAGLGMGGMMNVGLEASGRIGTEVKKRANKKYIDRLNPNQQTKLKSILQLDDNDVIQSELERLTTGMPPEDAIGVYTYAGQMLGDKASFLVNKGLQDQQIQNTVSQSVAERVKQIKHEDSDNVIAIVDNVGNPYFVKNGVIQFDDETKQVTGDETIIAISPDGRKKMISSKHINSVDIKPTQDVANEMMRRGVEQKQTEMNANIQPTEDDILIKPGQTFLTPDGKPGVVGPLLSENMVGVTIDGQAETMPYNEVVSLINKQVDSEIDARVEQQQLQQDQEKTQQDIKNNIPTARKLKVLQGKKETTLEAVPQEDGSYIVGNPYSSMEIAEKHVKQLNDRYANTNFEAVNITDPNDEFAETQVIIKTIPKRNETQQPVQNTGELSQDGGPVIPTAQQTEEVFEQGSQEGNNRVSELESNKEQTTDIESEVDLIWKNLRDQVVNDKYLLPAEKKKYQTIIKRMMEVGKSEQEISDFIKEKSNGLVELIPSESNKVKETKTPTLTPEQAERAGLSEREVPQKTTYSSNEQQETIRELSKTEKEYLDKMMPTMIADLKRGRAFEAALGSIRTIPASEYPSYIKYYQDKGIIDENRNYLNNEQQEEKPQIKPQAEEETREISSENRNQDNIGEGPVQSANEQEKTLTQKEIVEQTLQGGDAKSIKDIAEETNILEPNIRRILGVGTKQGVFERVGKGIYTITTKDGKNHAYINHGDAIEEIPKLAEQGFKADMVFLDIPYNTAGIKSGNRALSFDKIDTEQFRTLVKALSQIVVDEDTPVIHMFSTSKTGNKDMQRYTDIIFQEGFNPVAKGFYTKIAKNGNRLTMPMRKDPLPPEGLIVFTKSGKMKPTSKELDLDFTLVRPRGYSTEKPKELLNALITQTTVEGDMVLDPFAGSGVTGEQGLLLGRDVYLVEKSDKAVEEHIKPRLEKVAQEKEAEVKPTKKAVETKNLTDKQTSTLFKKIVGKNSLRILNNIIVKNGVARGTNLVTDIEYPINLKDGVYQIVGNKLVIDKNTNSDEFPLKLKHGKPVAENMQINGISSLIRKAINHVATASDAVPSMTGVHIYSDGNKIVVESTDAHALIKRVIHQNTPEFDIIIPKEQAEIITYNKTRDNLEISVYENDNADEYDNHQVVVLNNGEYKTTSRTIDSKYPKVNAVIPYETQMSITLNNKQLLDAVKKVLPFVSKRKPQIHLYPDHIKGTMRVLGYDVDRNIQEEITIPMQADIEVNRVPEDVNIQMPMLRLEDESESETDVIRVNPKLLINHFDNFDTDNFIMGLQYAPGYKTYTKPIIITDKKGGKHKKQVTDVKKESVKKETPTIQNEEVRPKWEIDFDNVVKNASQEDLLKILPGYGVSAARFANRYGKPGTDDYKSAYNTFFKYFENLKETNAKTSSPEEIKEEEAKVETNPTDAQIEAENYRKGHIKVQGLDITIENPKGSERSGTDENGKAWSQEMNNTYGYFKRTKGKDGDQVDLFLGDNLESEKVFVVDQVNPESQEFDEHKVMLGFNTEEEAKQAYLSNYEEGWKGLGNITAIGLEQFKTWLGNGTRKQKPFADYKEVKQEVSKEFTVTSPVKKTKHTKTGKDLYVVALPEKINDWAGLKEIGFANKGRWSRFTKGFNFSTQENADQFRKDVENKFGKPIETKVKEESKAKHLGVNHRGNNVFTDEKGVRYYTQGGIKVTQSVQINPDGFVYDGPEVLFNDGNIEFLTDDEIKQFKQQRANELEEKRKNYVPRDGWENHLIKAREYALNLLGSEKLGKLRESKKLDWTNKESIVKAINSELHRKSFMEGSIAETDLLEGELPKKKRKSPEFAGEIFNTPETQQETEKPSDSYGADNKIVSNDRYEELKKRMKDKLNNMNIGFDPEMLAIGSEMAAYHMEAGARKFADFANRMIKDLGENIKPYLKAFYNGAKDLPGMEEFSKDMDSNEYVSAYDFENSTYNPLTNEENISNLATNNKDNEQQRNTTDKDGENPETVYPGESSKTLQNGEGTRGILRDEGEQSNRTKTESSKQGDELQRGRRNDLARTNGDKRTAKLNSNNYSIPNNYKTPKTFSKAQNFDNNIEALSVLVELEQSGKKPTNAQKETLWKYVGFGGIKEILYGEYGLNYSDAQRVKKVTELVKKLDPDGKKGVMEAIKSSIHNAHYTSVEVIKGIYSVINNAGFKSGNILEPSMGTGHFFGALPKQIRENAKLTGIELDYVTGKIASYLYPDANIQITGLQNARLSNNYFDMIVGNIPFGNLNINDKSWKGLNDPAHKVAKSRVHNYFTVKMIELAKPGGLIAFVTSNATLDTPGNGVIRRYMADNAEFLGAIRLPNTAFKGNAGTEVTTDVIFLRKFKEGEERTQKYDFTNLKKKTLEHKGGYSTHEIEYNEYFHQKPNMMIGEPKAGGLYDAESFHLQGDPEKDILSQIRQKAKYIIDKEVIKTTETPVETNQRLVKEYEGIDNDFVRDGNIVIQENKFGKIEVKKTEYETTKNFVELKINAPKGKLTDFINFRTTLSELMYHELKGSSDSVLDPLRQKLNDRYDSFVKKHGRFNSRANKFIEEDVDNYVIRALENFDNDNKFIGKADIFTQRTINPIKHIDKVTNAEEAIVVSLDEYGYVNPERIKELLGGDWYQQIEEHIFENPDNVGTYSTKEEYLTGNVRQKLVIAENAAEINDRFKRNVEALRTVIPQDIPTSLINIRIGARWVPDEVYTEFARELLKTGSVKITTVADKYKVDKGRYPSTSGEITTTYGTKDKDGYDILLAALNDGTIKVYRTIRVDGKDIREIDQKATTAAQEKVDLIKSEFDKWLRNENQHKVLESLGQIYNESFNAVVKRKYSGQHLTFPGLTGIELRPHQIDAVWMLLQNKGGVIDHIVGAGKTLVMITTAMEMRRTGVSKKPLIIALKPTVQQISEEFRRTYPLSKVLSPTEKDFSKKNRNKLLAKIATNDWDAVILSHDQYKMLEHENDIEREVVREELDMIDASLEYLYGESNPSNLTKRQIKGLQQRKDNLYAKIQERIDRKTDAYTFEKLGIDHIFIDESHQFKNLSFSTSHNNIAGLGSPSGNEKTTALLMGVRALQRVHQGDKGVTFLSGTPISNSMVELYLILRYLRPNKLKEININSFDGWASVFAERSKEIEFSVTGQLKSKDRFRTFTNVPELSALYAEIADVRNDDNLVLPKPSKNIELVNITPSDRQKEYTEQIIDFASTGSPNPMLGLETVSENKQKAKMLLATGLGAKMSTDIRMINETEADEETSKINQAAIKINEIYNKTNNDKGVQLVFSDIGTPRKEFNVYSELKRKLTDYYNLPESEVVFIHDATSDIKRLELFKRVNDGEVRVLIGSTGKMGTGVNVQQRVVAMHHIDIPWKPADFEQRNGRGVRQGNKVAETYGNKVDIYVYALERSLDAYKFQLLETKQKFIDQIKNGSISDRIVNEGSGDDADVGFAEFVAITSGNPAILDKAKVDKKVLKLNESKRIFEEEKYNAKRKLVISKDAVIRADEFAVKSQQDQEYIISNGLTKDKDGKIIFSINVNGNTYTKPKDAGTAILKDIKDGKKLDVNGYGLKLSIERVPQMDASKPDKFKYHYIGESGLKWGNNTLSEDPTFAAMSITEAVKQIERALPQAQERKRIAESEIKALEKVLTNEWKHEQELEDLLEEQQRLEQVLKDIEGTEKGRETTEGEEETVNIHHALTSPTEEALPLIKQNKATPEQWKSMLLKNGAKQAELDWMDFNEAFGKKAIITKLDIQDWINKNRIEIVDVLKQPITDDIYNQIEEIERTYNVSIDIVDNPLDGSPDPVISGYQQDEMSASEWDDYEWAIKEEVFVLLQDVEKVRYKDYQTPGGKNYKELLLTMPNKVENYSIKFVDGKWYVVDPNGILVSKNGYKVKNMAEISANIKNSKYNRPETGVLFDSKHFDEPNIVAHVRFNERTDTKGNKILFLEEIQSDWAQQGKKNGFKPKKLSRADIKVRNDRNVWVIYFPNGRGVDVPHNLANTEQEAIDYAVNNLEQLQSFNSYERKVADMPFKHTSQWTGLVLKRMTEYAVENGFDMIAWTKGEQQAERYSLSRYANNLKYFRNDNSLELYDEDGEEVFAQYVGENDLHKYVGKEIAEKILNERKQQDEERINAIVDAAVKGGMSKKQATEDAKHILLEPTDTVERPTMEQWNRLTDAVEDRLDLNEVIHDFNYESIVELTGQDITIGGEGMKAFYDKIIPSTAKKLFKKYGVEVDNTVISTPKVYKPEDYKKYPEEVTAIIDKYVDDGVVIADELTKIGYVVDVDLGGDIGGFYKKGEVEEVAANSMKLTPDLIKAANKGFTMFSFIERPQVPELASQLFTDEYLNKFYEWEDAAVSQANNIASEIGVKINVVRNESELPKKYANSVKAMSKKARSRGFFDADTGEVYVILSNNKNTSEIREVILHETVGHKGLRLVFGKEFNKMLEEIYRHMTPEQIQELVEKGYDPNDAYSIAEEFLAHKTNDAKQLNFIRRAIAKIRQWIREKFGLKYSNNDINYLFELSKEKLKGPDPQPPTKTIRKPGIVEFRKEYDTFWDMINAIPRKDVNIHRNNSNNGEQYNTEENRKGQTKAEEKEVDIRHSIDRDKENLSTIYDELEDNWFGQKDWEKVKASIEASNFQNRIKQAHKNNPVLGAKSWQDVDKAIHIFLDTLGQESKIAEVWGDLSKEQRRLVTLSQNLTPELRSIAWDIRKEYDLLGSYALDNKAIFNVLDNYVSRQWDLKNNQNPTEFWRKFGTTTKHAKRRTLGTILDGWAMKDENGKSMNMQLAIEGATNNLSILKSEIYSVIENKKLIDQGLEAKDSEGRPLFVAEGRRVPDGYKKVNHPNFSTWIWHSQLEHGKDGEFVDIHKYKDRDTFIDDEGTVFKRKQIYAPGPIADKLNNVLSDSAWKGIPVLDFFTRVNAALKRTVLSWSFFHHMAFARSYWFAGALFSDVKGKIKRGENPLENVNIRKAYKDGLQYIKEMHPDVELLVKNGLTLGRIQDWDELFLEQKGKIAKVLDKHNVAPGIREKVRNLHEQHTNFLFNKFGAGLKAKTALLEFYHLQMKYPHKDISELARMAAVLVNKDFGGLHLERMGRNKTRQHFLRLMLLAPDWTESNVMTLVGAFGYDYSNKPGQRKLSKEESSVYRNFWLRAGLRVAFLSIATNLALALLDGEDDDDYWETVEKRYKDAFQNPERLNWLAADVTPLYKALSKDADPNKRKYFSVAGHFKDPYKWVVQVLSGSASTPIKNKGSIFTNTAVSLLFTGTNWQGKRYTSLSELMGVDDKGKYSTSKLNPDWKKGDPYEDKYIYKVGDKKGGQKAGQLTKWATPGQSGGVETRALPSFILAKMRDWMPIPVQNITAFAMGELDGFDALSHGVGMHMSNNTIKVEDISKEYNKIEKESEIIMRRVNLAKKDQKYKEQIELQQSEDFKKASLIHRNKGIIKDYRERYTEALNRSDLKTADRIKLQMEVKMQQIVEQYNKQ